MCACGESNFTLLSTLTYHERSFQQANLNYNIYIPIVHEVSTNCLIKANRYMYI